MKVGTQVQRRIDTLMVEHGLSFHDAYQQALAEGGPAVDAYKAGSVSKADLAAQMSELVGELTKLQRQHPGGMSRTIDALLDRAERLCQRLKGGDIALLSIGSDLEALAQAVTELRQHAGDREPPREPDYALAGQRLDQLIKRRAIDCNISYQAAYREVMSDPAHAHWVAAYAGC